MERLDGFLEKFEEQGCVVIPNFLNTDDLQSIKDEINRIVHGLDLSEEKTAFRTTDDQVESHNKYFLDSADRISYFFEEDALDNDGNLQVPKSECLNKIGHALHWESPIFKGISFKAEVKNIVKSLGFVDPALIQSMYIFKNPRIGGTVTAHIDRTFLHNDPCKLVGFWFAVEEVTLENGCLWYIPGSHKTENISRRLVKTKGGRTLLQFTGEQREFSADEFIPAPVPAGGLVLIHGQVVHKSERNLSQKPRPAYTFHVIDTYMTNYASDNWLQPTAKLPFTKLFEN